MHVANQLHDYGKLKANTQGGNLNGPTKQTNWKTNMKDKSKYGKESIIRKSEDLHLESQH